MTNQSIARNNSNKPATVADKGTLESLLNGEAFKNTLQTVLPKHLTPERVVKMALVAASRQPRLWECTKESILQSIMKSAELGLDCSGTLGRAYLVPYYNNKIGAYEAQFIPGYQGLIELARRSGSIARIESRVVYENDRFEVEYGLDQKLSHTPSMNGDRGLMKCVYAVAELTDGSRQIEIMTMDEVEGIRLRSKAKDSGPWKTDYAEMARKTVIRRIAKYLPLSTEMEKAFEADDQLFADRSAALDIAERTITRANALREQLSIVQPAEPESEVPATAETSVEPTPAETAEEPATDQTPAEKPDAEESKMIDMQTAAIECFRDLEGDDRLAAEKFLGTKAIKELSAKKLGEFLEKFRQ
jgi:recombination protein RecT